MPQLFRPSSNAIAKFSLLAVAGLLIGGLAVGEVFKWSTYMTRVNEPEEQPVPFSHKHHYSGLGIDCRYCHTSVETSASAGIPPTHTCMTCHSQIWTNAKILEPVRSSYRTGQPLEWHRVYRIPEYVYFNHSIHVQKGVGCSSCHGQIHQMPLTAQAKPFYMKDCLECHRNPARFLRPRDQVFNMDWRPPGNQLELGKELAAEYHVPKQRLTDCSTCHR